MSIDEEIRTQIKEAMVPFIIRIKQLEEDNKALKWCINRMDERWEKAQNDSAKLLIRSATTQWDTLHM